MALVANRAVLTQEAGELTVEPGSGIHERLVWCDNPVCQLEHTGFLIAEQLLTAEALLVAPDQIEIRITVADQIPGFLHRQAGGMGDHQVYALAAIGPEPYTTEASALPAAQLQPAHLTAQRRCGAVDLSVTT